jgi:hypothetical protein
MGHPLEPSGIDILTSVRDRDEDLVKTSGSVRDWDWDWDRKEIWDFFGIFYFLFRTTGI